MNRIDLIDGLVAKRVKRGLLSSDVNEFVVNVIDWSEYIEFIGNEICKVIDGFDDKTSVKELENFIHDIKKASDEFNLNLHNKTSYFEPNQITDLMSHVRPEAFTKLRLDLMDDENFEIFKRVVSDLHLVEIGEFFRNKRIIS